MKLLFRRMIMSFGKWGALPLLSLLVAGSVSAADEKVISLLDFGAVDRTWLVRAGRSSS